ncbi:YqjF family protein [Streptosporangium sp. CA-135522]|uniref:YqjF family protein n=1 Tax=Streptosporangium sp. CA-135522 TaxID=3240072 RepID=UPI003D93F266
MRTTQVPRVTKPVMYHRWSHMTFIHWRYPSALVQSLLPGGLTVEEFDGSAWVGLTPFLMTDVRVPGMPVLPWLSRFPETNVRTYVRDARGRSGLWFLSLDAGRLAAVLGARAGYRLPYHWSDMSVRAESGRHAYRCRRRWPGPAGARCDVGVELGAPLADSERDELTDFLTERYRLFTVIGGRPAHAEVEHRPWPLQRARLTHLDQGLVQAGGLCAPDHDPIVHASAGVRVRVGMWNWSRP